ncbi:MAG: site-specific DNA-methyltransferase [Pseudomonadota bacterium]
MSDRDDSKNGKTWIGGVDGVGKDSGNGSNRGKNPASGDRHERTSSVELWWAGRAEQPAVEAGALVEDPEKSHRRCVRGTGGRVGKSGYDNRIIRGDNLPVLKLLAGELAGRVSCVLIDPPYNRGNTFAQYADGLEHSTWLFFMRSRLELLKVLLAENGSLWITVDDTESHYLKVLCDGILGRGSFVANVVWRKKYTIANDARWFSGNHDHVLVYCKNPTRWRPRRLPRTARMDARYSNPDNDPRGPWKSTPLHAKSGSEKTAGFCYTFANGVRWSPPPGTFARYSTETLRELERNNAISFPRKADGTPRRKSFLADVGDVVAPTVWLDHEVGHNHEAKTEVKAFNGTDVFATPKPERLIHRILTLATDPGDLVLDAFAGSGTTGAVAHKMGRRWIMIEIGTHCDTHIHPRLESVVDGRDPGGITGLAGWLGGGGFGYYRFVPSSAERP